MDYNDIGTIIASARKKKNLTQDELASKLHITRQAVSNWETNKSLPDIGIILKLCEVLDLDFNKFIGVANGSIKAEDVIKYEKKKITKKTVIIIAILTVIFALISFTIYMVLNKNAFAVYDVYLDSNEFSLNNSVLVKSKINNYFKLGTLKCNLDDVPEDTVFNIKLYSVQDKEEVVLLERTYKDNLSVTEEYGYNKYFSNDIYNTDKLYLEVTYNIKNQEYSNTYPLTLNLNFESNRLFYKEKPKIIDNINILFDIDKLYIDNLVVVGYEYNEEDNTYIRNFNNGEFVYYVNPNYIAYSYDDSKKQLKVRYHLEEKRLEVDEYNYEDDSKSLKFLYSIEDKNMVCTTGNCADVDSYLNVITEEIKKINK